MNRGVRSVDDLLRLLDGLFDDRSTSDWWDRFYTDRDRPVPFFVSLPDENLDGWLRDGPLRGGRALELGCGPGRNALRLAAAGYEVDAIDLSPTAIAWARERAGETPGVRFHCADIFAVELPHETYDLVYDSGCLHHLAPHRRISYLALLDRRLAPGGHFGLTCFAAGTGDANSGVEIPDAQLYRDGSLHGGLAYDPDDLRRLFGSYTEVELRAMNGEPADGLFGVPFLLTGLFSR
ncbi:class I SAM-dependent methyltransferase [Amycolatopsis sp. DG1A-15b]|uniref:class I SAM-dependent methyltransferase n=1 Tax=Amycolatopsis sp. DG1A-15b TaxID=3052846 RepID=UPI00255BF1B7|nr:class I SAM-dependent methyltransferase [Amycolatopsis sp. DG1A-15b]WIX84837.1 class I SAM-dependent methyltransferase [Amycolatopsis sp. DG1A-15b]